MSAGDRSVHCAIVAGGVGRFACKEERVLERRSQHFLRAIRAYRAIAVRSPREGIALPVMKVCALQEPLKLFEARSR